jgi:NAD(P)-dependent dehydrogenase (short-subunit alcohol dehydrogenase family)
MGSLSGKVAFVTGGSRGIGLAIARVLVLEGAQVAITGKSDAHLSAARPLIEAEGPASVETLKADVRRYEDVERALAAVVSRFGGLDIVINNAGVGIFANVADMSPEQWSEVIDTNLTGVFHVCHAAIPHLRRRGGGTIINISSLAGKNAFTTAAAYCASKAGLNAFSEALMQEVRYDNIRVSYVMPGSVATEFAGGDEAKGADWKTAPEDVADVVRDLLQQNPRSLASRVELRPSKPRK